MRRSLSLALLAALLVIAAAPASAGGGGGSPCAAFADGRTVTMLDNCFSGTAQFAPGGGTLRVVNDGRVAHTYTAVDGSFDTGRLAPGEAADLMIEPGIHRVYCTLHASLDAPGSGMAGLVLVGVDDAELTAATVSDAPASTGPGSRYATPVAALALAVSLTALLANRRRTASTGT